MRYLDLLSSSVIMICMIEIGTVLIVWLSGIEMVCHHHLVWLSDWMRKGPVSILCDFEWWRSVKYFPGGVSLRAKHVFSRPGAPQHRWQKISKDQKDQKRVAGLHGTATVAMAYLILDLWDCGLYWYQPSSLSLAQTSPPAPSIWTMFTVLFKATGSGHFLPLYYL